MSACAGDLCGRRWFWGRVRGWLLGWRSGCDLLYGFEECLATVQSGKSRTGAKAELRQQSQQEGAKKANSPQSKHIDHRGWTVASVRLFAILYGSGVEWG